MNNTTATNNSAVTGLVTHVEVDVSRFELDAIKGGNERMRQRLADRVLASIYDEAESEKLIAEPGDLIEYHAGDAARTPRDGLFVGHDDEGRVVVSDEDGNVDHVPPFRVHGVF